RGRGPACRRPRGSGFPRRAARPAAGGGGPQVITVADRERYEAFLALLRNVRRTSETSAQACCPAHDDHDPSLSVSLRDDGKILGHCHKGCEIEQILGAVGWSARDLFRPREQLSAGDFEVIVAYDYVDENGRLLYQNCRMKPTHKDPKPFRQRQPN